MKILQKGKVHQFCSSYPNHRKALLRFSRPVKDSFYYPPKTSRGHWTYTVVSVIGSNSPYTDPMLASLLRQMLDFRACIQIVIVDTRSMEVASETERGWAERFPSNITYLRHENKSLAGARNAGMARATGDWITFIAPHDLLDADYFLNVDRALQAEKQADSLHLIACNRITFEEEGDTLTDADPLRYRFQYGRRRVVFDDTCADIEISVTAVFFNRQKLLETGLTFKELGTGEEFYFVAHYLLMAKEPEVLFLPEARYRCRQQADEPLPPDTKKNNPTWYSTLLRDIYLDLLKRAHAHPLGPPRWLQRAIVYELVWHFKRQFDDHRKASWVPAKLRPGYIELLQAILGRIDPAILASFELTDVTDLHRLAMLALADRTAERVSKVELIAFDKAQETVCLHYYYVGPQPELQVMMGADVASPTADKTRIHRFMFNPLVREYIGWFAWQGDGLLTLFINGKRVEQDLSLRAKEAVITRLNSSAVNPQYFSASVRLKRFLGQLPVLSHRFKKGWVLIDRDTQADDNAEHLYRYIRANHSQVNAWFVLRKTSHDWDRLKKEGFRLLAFGSLSHKLALLHAQHLISSHVEPYVTYLPPNNYNDLIQRDTTFLQHGVIKDDLSGWLNRKSLRHFATSAPKEYDSVCADETPYKFTEREMALTGLPRHDRLIKKRDVVAAKTVLIMPTWRSSLVSVATDAYGYSVKNAAFLQSTFYRTWSSFLNSPELRNLAAEYGYELVFFPHSELKAYVEDFKAEHVRIVGHSDVDSIQDLFLNAEIMITDYSSVAFEMAYLERPILYYQFDEDFVFNGGHIYEQGYFDYREDGFGPVCTDQTELLQELELILGNQGGAFEPYRQRMKDFFAFRDGRCCERVFELIAKG